MSRVACKVRAIDRVQGVFFRAWAAEQARELGVGGWVWNLGDGAVEAHLEGDDKAVSQLIERMRLGPPTAKVENLDVKEVATENFSRFDVRH